MLMEARAFCKVNNLSSAGWLRHSFFSLNSRIMKKQGILYLDFYTDQILVPDAEWECHKKEGL